TYIFLMVIGLFNRPYDYALSMSIVAAVTYPIPYLGIAVSGLLGGILAYFQSENWGYTLAIFLIIIIVNNLIDQFMRPKIMSDVLHMNPVFIMFAAFAGAELMGLLGMIIGIPMAAMIMAILTYIYKKFLADKEEIIPAEQAVDESKIAGKR
ncbi:MAG: AI-2E family transporter, partial [Candidatus Eremiobacteraeota bacterium]|nr:AI-2E family transporter [Candidatus Eremiobacteraeota bacterium]